MGDLQQNKQLSKAEKAAIIFLYMDDQITSDVFGNMQDEEIKKIANAMLHMHKIPADQIQTVLEEFLNGYNAKPDPKANSEVPIEGAKIVDNLLSKNLSRNRSQSILSSIKNGDKQIAASSNSEGDFKKIIQEQAVDTLYEMFENEHPQIIAIVLANSKKVSAKELLEKYPEDIQPELLLRMASLTKVPGKMMNELKEYVVEKLNARKTDTGVEQKVKKQVDIDIEGMSDTVKLLKALKKDKSSKILEDIEKIDSEIGAQISKLMFTIEDLQRANDVGIRELLRAISNDDMKIALKNSPDSVKDKFFGNMSQRAAMILREDMEVMPALKVEEIDLAQNNILRAAKELMKEEKLVLAEASAGDEE